MYSTEEQLSQQLISDVIRGVPKGFKAFFDKYEYLTNWCVNKILINKSENRDDLLSIAKVGLIEAAHKYDPQRGTKFETYAIDFICYKLIGSWGPVGGLSVDSGIQRLVNEYKQYAHESKIKNLKFSIEMYITNKGLMKKQAQHFRWAVSVLTNTPTDIDELRDSVELASDSINFEDTNDTFQISSHKKAVELIKESISYLNNPSDIPIGTTLINSVLEDKDFNELLQNDFNLTVKASSAYNTKVRVMRHIREFLEYHEIDESIIQ